MREGFIAQLLPAQFEPALRFSLILGLAAHSWKFGFLKTLGF
jgi:hypothetical protein